VALSDNYGYLFLVIFKFNTVAVNLFSRLYYWASFPRFFIKQYEYSKWLLIQLWPIHEMAWGWSFQTLPDRYTRYITMDHGLIVRRKVNTNIMPDYTDALDHTPDYVRILLTCCVVFVWCHQAVVSSNVNSATVAVFFRHSLQSCIMQGKVLLHWTLSIAATQRVNDVIWFSSSECDQVVSWPEWICID
jgi:hypothetical protein